MFYFENYGCPQLKRYNQQTVVALYPATASTQSECVSSPMICAHFQSGDKVDIPISGLKGVDGAISSSLHKTRSGKMFKAEIDASAAKGCHAYPIIDFRKEDLRHPYPATDTQDQGFLVKSKFGYLSENPAGGNELQYTRDIRSAHVFSFAEAVKTLNTSCGTWKKARIVSAKGKDAPYDSVILVTDRNGGNSYYVRRSSKRIWTSYAEENAKIYPRRTDANSALKRLSSVLTKMGWTAQVIKRSNAIS